MTCLRSGRLHDFASLDEVQEVLADLAEHRFGTMVAALPRQPGTREVRWTQLLGVPADASPAPTVDATTDMGTALPVPPPPDAPAAAPPTGAPNDVADRLDMLERRVESLEEQLADALDDRRRPVGE